MYVFNVYLELNLMIFAVEISNNRVYYWFFGTQNSFEFVGVGYYVKKTGIEYVYSRFLMYKSYQVYLNSQKTICLNN